MIESLSLNIDDFPQAIVKGKKFLYKGTVYTAMSDPFYDLDEWKVYIQAHADRPKNK
jgi:hypothetical protein